MHDGRLEYHELQRAGQPGIWRPILGVLLAVGAFIGVTAAWLVPFSAYLFIQGYAADEALNTLAGVSDPTPVTLAYLTVSLASLIPAVWLLGWALHGLKPGWLSSIRPRIRWGYFCACLLVSMVALVATVLVSLVLPDQQGTGPEVSGQLNDFTRQTRDFLLIVVFLTPLQAAGEEYFFRGYLTQAFGGFFSHFSETAAKILAVVVPSILFALAHGIGQSVPIFFVRLAFGIVAGTLVILTGGLEAGIAMHVLNNLLAFGLALAYGDIASSLNPSGGSWWGIPVTLTQSLVYLGLAVLVARRMGLSTTADPAVLAASRGPVYRIPSAQA
jgi:membrane protease YdiL (CAAX protease family)